MESYDNMMIRHEREMQELADEIKNMLKTAKKSIRSQIEAQAVQMEFDLKAKHREEEDAWEEAAASGSPIVSVPVSSTTITKEEGSPTKQQGEIENIQAKKLKAKKKQEKRENKEKKREEMKNDIRTTNQGLSQRDIEISLISKQLEKEKLTIKPILSDGHCLYR
jgi:hypothetical protein